MASEPSTSPIRGSVAFAGRLASMTRDEAFALVRAKGGTPRRGLPRKTTILGVGGRGWPPLREGTPSESLSLANPCGVAIASERQFLEWAGRAVPDEQARTYSASQIASLSGLPPEVVEQLTALGLLDGRDGRHGFHDLSAARQLAELLQSGVALPTIARSLHEIRKWLPDAALSNLRLYPDASDAILVEQLKGRTDKTGQFVLPVGGAQEDADALFEQAQSAEEAKDIDTAQRLYRRVMRMDPRDPAAAFNLGNLLRSLGQKVEAEAAYRAATKADAGFAEAWYNLADILDDQGQCDKAAICLARALDADPNYADALFNLGLLHLRDERLAEAATCWRRYLAPDQDSAWADGATHATE